eukprot:6172802-Pleurochrysis_carterae.AAC.2
MPMDLFNKTVVSARRTTSSESSHCGLRQACSASSFGNVGTTTLLLSAHDPSPRRGDYTTVVEKVY